MAFKRSRVRSSPSPPEKSILRDAFFNDVCPDGQMMYPAGMMLPMVMMCALRHMGKHHIIVSICSQHHFGVSQNIISRKAAASLVFNMKYDTIIVK